MTAGFGVGFVVCGRGSCGAMRELGAVLTRCFTGSFVCRLKRRVGAVLGTE